MNMMKVIKKICLPKLNLKYSFFLGFKCDMCGESFKSKAAIATHVLKCGKGVHKCLLCQLHFKSAVLLRNHACKNPPVFARKSAPSGLHTEEYRASKACAKSDLRSEDKSDYLSVNGSTTSESAGKCNFCNSRSV